MKRFTPIALALTATLTAHAALLPDDASLAIADEARPVVELAICLDVSGSMNGLIDGARARIWDIVNELALATPVPTLRVALLSYGHNDYPREEGWVRVDSDFTEDLDLISERLFALTLNGGVEYVGRVLDRAAGLSWTHSPMAESRQTMRLAVVAGNESADQDQQVPYRAVVQRMIASGIVVHSIFCGPEGHHDAPGWREIATLGDGRFAAIDQSIGAITVETPFDAELLQLSHKFSAVSLPYGAVGEARWTNQRVQDVNAAQMNVATAASRAAAKCSVLYCSASWDLIDACRDAKFDLEAIPDAELPEAMRGMDGKARRAHVAKATAERDAIAERSRELAAQRAKIVAAAAAEAARNATDRSSMDFRSAIIAAVREQAIATGMTFPEPGC